MDRFLKENSSREMLLSLFAEAPVAMVVLMGEDFIFQAVNKLALQLFGKDEAIVGKPLLKAIPELKDQKFPAILRKVLDSGKTYHGHHERALLHRNGELQEAFFDYIYSALRDADGKVIGIHVIATEVTETIRAIQEMQESENRYRDLILNADVATAIYKGEEMVVEMANDRMLRVWGKDKSVIGKKLKDALPELDGQPFHQLLADVHRTGNTYKAEEDRVDLVVDGKLQTFYYNFSYKAIRNISGEIIGILNMAVNVTEQVLAKRRAQENEARIRSIILNAPLPMVLLRSEKLIFEICNERNSDLWALPDDVVGQSIIERFDEHLNHPVIAAAREPFLTGKPSRLWEYRIETEEGETDRYVNYVFHPLFDAERQVEAVIGTGYEVTEELRIRRQLRANEEKFRMLANSMPTIAWTTDRFGNVEFFNDKWYAYTGTDSDGTDDNDWLSAVHEDDRKRVGKLWEKCVRGGSAYETEYRLQDKSSNRYRWFLVRGIPLRDENGEIIQWIGNNTDIHDFKMLQNQKDDFLGIASHELKTPLTSIKAYAQVLEKKLRKTGDDKNADFVMKMDRQVNKLNSLIADLLDVTKIQNGKMQYTEGAFCMGDLVEEVVEQLRHTADKYRIDLVHNDKADVYGDKDRIGQVIINLISNAMKYSPQNEQINVTCVQENGQVTICVQDFGIGLPDDKQDKVFEQYYRVSGDKQHTFPGLGLGLYISSEIVKRAGGRIWVNSVLGKGSTFCFSLPTAGENEVVS
ncbi:MAG: PAS domain S-box protein [Chryseobacterium sp.]|nr:MAG: PAS domain S-box protein [Chryseobacterium sp.]